MPAPKRPTAATDTPEAQDAPSERTNTGRYYVDAVGVPYEPEGLPGAVLVATYGQVIDLSDEDARRLLSLGAIRAATDDEVEADKARRARVAEVEAQNTIGPASNPFGGRVMAGVSLEDHAAEQIELARKAGRL